jgi:hypothetical protein
MLTGQRPLPAPIRRGGKRAVGAALRVSRRPVGVRICVYHHVDDGQWDGFRRQLDWMQSAGVVVPYSAAIDMARGGGTPRPVFALSLDDGYRSWPAVADELSSRGLSAMFFTVTSRLGLPEAGVDWAALRTMAAQGMEVGSHTTDHVYLSEQDDMHAEAALRESKAELESGLSAPCAHFAFPCGVPVRAFQPKHVEMVRRCGYESAATTIVGRQRGSDDPFLIRRTRLEPDWPLWEVAFAVARLGPASAFAS